MFVRTTTACCYCYIMHTYNDNTDRDKERNHLPPLTLIMCGLRMNDTPHNDLLELHYSSKLLKSDSFSLNLKQ